MTLIAVYNSSGCVGRCDASCFSATRPACDCICGGRNHGVGLELATAQTASMAAAWIDRYVSDRQISGHQAEVFGAAALQTSLFG